METVRAEPVEALSFRFLPKKEGPSTSSGRTERVSTSASADDPEDVAFLHDQQVLAVEAALGAGPFAEQDLVAGLDVERRDRAVLAARAGAGGDDLALLGLLLGGVGDGDAGGRRLLGLDAAAGQP